MEDKDRNILVQFTQKILELQLRVAVLEAILIEKHVFNPEEYDNVLKSSADQFIKEAEGKIKELADIGNKLQGTESIPEIENKQ